MEETGFHPDLIHAIFKLEWSRRSLEREKNENPDAMDCEVDAGAGTSKKSRPMSANANALKLSSKLVQIFISEAVQRAATIAEAEGIGRIEPTHLERVLPHKLANMIDVSQTEWDWGGEASQVMKSSLIPIQTSI
ncbi:centromere protein X isoform X2 [Cucumis melo var. makuwa]|uniref:Centromere protein X isoform X2 n=1 Tax=Cucumis melo var. makuwa TaxID=1194695 RepID=A0A5A7UPL0_CUCMM|nr:centromere protein X isoform X2 [Cucumis melo var. makuwa]